MKFYFDKLDLIMFICLGIPFGLIGLIDHIQLSFGIVIMTPIIWLIRVWGSNMKNSEPLMEKVE